MSIGTDHELPPAETAYEGPIADGNSTAKRRQTLMWGICIAAVTVMGGFVIYNMMKPTPRGNDPEAAQRLLATAEPRRP
ncbi:MAG: hypothetical protein RDU12_15520, partial [Brevundimonas sp.]|nr:hypothetical protein [Brevundimonas sp.]